jgi:spore maturation protein CgeB
VAVALRTASDHLGEEANEIIMRLRVALVGSFWPASLEASYQRAFNSLGVQVMPIDHEKALANEFGGTGLLRHVIGERAALKASAQTEKEILQSKPDLVLIFKGTRIPPAMIESIRRAAVIVNFNPDSPWEKANSSEWLLESIPHYHHHFTWSKQLLSEFTRSGSKSTHYLPFAYDPELHSLTPKGETDFDVVFIGTYESLRDQTLSVLKDKKVAIWGNGWEHSKKVPKEWIKGAAIYGKQAAEAMSRGVVNLNILRVQNAGSHNMRTFEIPATGNLMLTTKSDEQQEFFAEGDEILSYSNDQELLDRVTQAVANKALSSEMGLNAYERVKPETYSKRALEILTVCGFG